MIIFAYTQVPLALAEGLLTVVIFDYIKKLRPDILTNLGVMFKTKAPDIVGGK
jgi:cobalt/nickel transport system permease protein